MPLKSSFLGVKHEVIVKKPPYFQGDVLHAKVKVRNLTPKHIKRRFCYILRYPGGMTPRTMEFELGPNVEREYSLQPPYYLSFMGSFQIALLKGEAGTRFNEKGELEIPPGYIYDTLFPGNVRDIFSYIPQIRIAKAVEMMSKNIDTIRDSNKQIGKATDTIANIGHSTLYLTIAIVALVVVEIVTLFIG